MRESVFPPPLDSKTKQKEPVNRERRSCHTLLIVRTELACTRALLDELETVLDAGREGRTVGDVLVQVADQLVRMASTMKEWQDAGSLERRRDESLKIVPCILGASASDSKEQDDDIGLLP